MDNTEITTLTAMVMLPTSQQSPSHKSAPQFEVSDRQPSRTPETSLPREQKEEMRQLLRAVARGRLRLVL